MRRTRKLNPIIDMTPLADVAWLMLVFFVLSSRLKAPDPHAIDVPTITSKAGCFGSPSDVVIVVDAHNHVWLRFHQQARGPLLTALEKVTRQSVAVDRAACFLKLDEVAFGPKVLLEGGTINIRALQGGIVDVQTISDWMRLLKRTPLFGGVSILGDQNASYATIEKIFSAVQRVGVNRFNLLTTLEKDDF